MKWVYLTIAVMLTITFAVVLNSPQINAQEACYTVSDLALGYEIVGEVDLQGQHITAAVFYVHDGVIIVAGVVDECMAGTPVVMDFVGSDDAPADVDQQGRDGRQVPPN